MNTLDVLYKRCKTPMCDSKSGSNKDFLKTNLHTNDRFEMLLREANINVNEKLKKEPAAKVVNFFHKHPRNFNKFNLGDNLLNLESTDSDENNRSHTKIHIKTFKYFVDTHLNQIKLPKPQECVKAVTKKPNIKIIIPKQKTVAKKCTKQNTNQKMAESEKINHKKYTILQTMFKIAEWIQEINSLIHGGFAPSNDSNDYSRRKKCTIEFSSRFSRQYLYQFNRQLESLKKLSHRSTTNATTTNKKFLNNLKRWITNVCQTILHAVQAYCHHVPYTMIIENSMKNNSVHEKFLKMLNDISEFCGIIKTLSDIFVDVKDILSVSEEIKYNSQILATQLQESLLTGPEIQTSLTLRTLKKSSKSVYNYFNGNCLPYQKKIPLESRFSMYCVNPQRKSTGTNKNANNKNSVIRPRYFKIYIG